jgi:hypothetical protein
MSTKYTASKSLLETQRKLVRKHPAIKLDATHEEIDAWVDDNITSIGDIKTFLKVLAKRDK